MPQGTTTNYAPERGDLGGNLVPARNGALMNAQGYFVENYPRGAISNFTIMVSGTVYYLAIGLSAGDLVTSINSVCVVLGSGFSGVNMRAGVYTKGGVLVASTGDISAAYGSTGSKSSAVTTPYLVPSTDAYYVALVAIATTPPTLLRSGTGILAAPFGTATVNLWGSQTSQTDLPTTPAMLTSGNGYWVSLS